MSMTDGGRPADGPGRGGDSGGADGGGYGGNADAPGGYRPGEPDGPGGYGPPAGDGGPAGYGAVGGPPPRNGLGVAALVLGIAAVVFCWTVVGGVVLGIIAIILGIVGRGRVGRGEATNRGVTITGLVLGIVGLLLGILFGVLYAFVLHTFGVGDLANCMNRAGNDQAAQQQCTQEFANRVGVTPSP